MNKRKGITPAVTILCCLVLVSVAVARASATYELNWSVLASSGGRMQSAHHAMNSTLGQSSAIGRSASDNYRLGAGYWYGASMPEPTLAPMLSVPSNIPAYVGRPVDVPVNFASNGHEIAAVVFSVDFDEHCLAFDPTDSDGDGIPDAVSFNLPPAFAPAAAFDPDDTDGELDLSILDPAPPLASLPDGVIATITFTPTCAPDPGNVIMARVGFSDEPAASFGNTAGQSVPGTTEDGSVRIAGLQTYLPLVTRHHTP